MYLGLWLPCQGESMNIIQRFKIITSLWSFKGRGKRSEFWAIAIFSCVLCLFEKLNKTGHTYIAVLGLFFSIWLSFAVLVRRSHDMNLSGETAVLATILQLIFQKIGLILTLYFGLKKGTFGPNRYGPDSLENSENFEENVEENQICIATN